MTSSNPETRLGHLRKNYYVISLLNLIGLVYDMVMSKTDATDHWQIRRTVVYYKMTFKTKPAVLLLHSKSILVNTKHSRKS